MLASHTSAQPDATCLVYAMEARAWNDRMGGTIDPSALHETLRARLRAVDGLFARLSPQGAEDATAPISSRELEMARSLTVLSCRIAERQRAELAAQPRPTPDADADGSAAPGAPGTPRRSPCALFFEAPELLEHMLSFVTSPAQLARCGAVCTAWYLASRMQKLWEEMLRRSGRLIGPASQPLPLPHEEQWTLFETATRIERHGCRPLEGIKPEIGTIDGHVDDLGAYELTGEWNDATGVCPARASLSCTEARGSGEGGPGWVCSFRVSFSAYPLLAHMLLPRVAGAHQPAIAHPPSSGRRAVYSARHAERGEVRAVASAGRTNGTARWMRPPSL